MNAPFPIFRHLSTAAAGKSSGKCPVNLSEVLHGRPVNLEKMRCIAPELWAQMVKSGTGSTTHAGYLLGVDEKTIRNWLGATNAPAWPAVGAVLREIPPDRRLEVLNFLIGDDAA